MDDFANAPVYTRATRHQHRPDPCPSCGEMPEVGWVNDGRLSDMDRWKPNPKCRNPKCPDFRDPTSLAGA